LGIFFFIVFISLPITFYGGRQCAGTSTCISNYININTSTGTCMYMYMHIFNIAVEPG
jgi:hypothetical protein